MSYVPHVVAWNLTRRCNLECAHCYISAGPRESATSELETEECLRVVDQLLAVNPAPLLILSGGEPLLRHDLTQALTLDGQAARVAATAAIPNPDERIGIAAALAGAPARLVLHPEVSAALAALREDPDERVRRAAAWSAPLGEAAAARAELRALLQTRAMRLASTLWGVRDRARRWSLRSGAPRI